MNNKYGLSPLGEYLMSLPTVYEIKDETQDYTQPNRSAIVKSKLPISDKQVQKGIREFAPVIYTYTVKNIYEGGENTLEVK